MEHRLRYFVYRCFKCGRLLTRREIERKWAKLESTPELEDNSICPCGSKHLSPTNALWWEELLLPRVWSLWFFEILLPWIKGFPYSKYGGIE